MSIPTLQNVYDSARSFLGDDQTAGGELYTNTLLQPFFGFAYREMWRALAAIGSPEVKRTVFYVLPAYTSVLVPATANIADFGIPFLLEERGALTKATISDATINSSTPSVTFTTSAAHNFVATRMVSINGNMGLTGTDGMFGIGNLTDTTFDALGMVSGGSFSGSGTAVQSLEDFTEVRLLGGLDPDWDDGNAKLGGWIWQEGLMRFPLCTEERELRITYYADGTAPTGSSTSIGVEDCLNYLAARTAALAMRSRGNSPRADELDELALGPLKNTQKWDGFLGDLLYPAVKAFQARSPADRRRPPYRFPRSTTNTIW